MKIVSHFPTWSRGHRCPQPLKMFRVDIDHMLHICNFLDIFRRSLWVRIFFHGGMAVDSRGHFAKDFSYTLNKEFVFFFVGPQELMKTKIGSVLVLKRAKPMDGDFHNAKTPQKVDTQCFSTQQIFVFLIESIPRRNKLRNVGNWNSTGDRIASSSTPPVSI